MAYGDYQPGGSNTGVMGPRMPQWRMPGGPMSPGTPMSGAGASVGLPPPQQSPWGNGQVPQGTRQQALQGVQEAYAAPSPAGGGRMPGDMGYLNQLLGQSAAPVSANDPTIAPAFAAGRVADQRNIDRQRASLAEQLGGAGLGSSGAMQTKTSGIQQRVGEQQALRESGMLYDEGNARRNALLQALGLDQSRYGQDNDLGYKLAALEAQLNQNALQPFF